MANEPAPRHYPWYLLRDNNIPSVVWFEDALGHYGVSTIVFDLYLLVEDIEAAAQVLVKGGWSIVPYDPSKLDVGFSAKAHRRLRPPGAPEKDPRKSPANLPGPPPRPPPPTKRTPRVTTTILLPAAELNYKLPTATNVVTDHLYPPLPDLLDALIDSFLDCTPGVGLLFSYLACQVCYLYEYVPALKSASFAEQLKYEHRQFHFDSLSDMSTGTVPFAKHERAIRDALREGNYTLQKCSASRDNILLFNQAEEARVLASMRQRESSNT